MYNSYVVVVYARCVRCHFFLQGNRRQIDHKKVITHQPQVEQVCFYNIAIGVSLNLLSLEC